MGLRTAGKVVAALVIVGTLGALWVAYDPAVKTTVRATPPPPPPTLHDTRAVVVVLPAGSDRAQRSRITCDAGREAATGFWAPAPSQACDALASTRGPLLAGAGCRRPRRGQTELRARGSFGRRRFDHRALRGGCPDIRGWLAVNALALPVLEPDQELTDAGS
jgi:hypothetical protein